MSAPAGGDGAGSSGTVCFDFADPETGVAALVRTNLGAGSADAHGLLLTADGESIGMDGVRVSDDGERASVSMETDGAGLEAELTRLAGAALEPGSAFSDAAGLTEEAFAARVEGEWRAGGASGRIECVGRVVRTSGSTDWDRVELVRSLTAALDDGSLLVVASARPAGAPGHGDEQATGVLVDPDRSLVRFDESLISTEYDPDRHPRRVGVELWSADGDAVAVRGAGTAFASAAGTTFLRFTLDGKPGTARYELTKAG